MKNRKAFTLIELLVVISIIALLVSILMPALNNARQQATGAACLANQKTLALAWVMYYNDNDGRLPWADRAGWSPDSSIKPWAYFPDRLIAGMEPKYDSIKNGVLYPYVETVEAYHCPGDKRYQKTADAYPDTDILGGYRSYSIAGGLFGAALDIEPAFGIVHHTKASTIKHPSEKYAFVEETDSRGGNLGAWHIHPVDSTSSWPNGDWWDPLALWHNDASTLGFCDGHAELHRWDEVNNVVGYVFWPQSDGDDLVYMQRGYAYKRLAP